MYRIFRIITQLLFLVTVVFPRICSGWEKQDSGFLRINFNAVSTIRVNVKNVDDTILLKSRFYTFFPNNYSETNPVKLIGNGTVYLNLKIQVPQKVDLSFKKILSDTLKKNNGRINSTEEITPLCFLVPFDTLVVDVEFSQREYLKPTITYHGKYAQISDYYQSKEEYFHGNDFIYQKGMLSNTATDLNSFKTTLDSITDVELGFLKNYLKKTRLPQWFTDYERSDLEYFAFVMKLDEPMLMKYIHDTAAPLQNDYFSFTKELLLNNESAVLSVYYFLSLREYFTSIVKPLLLKDNLSGRMTQNPLKDFAEYSIYHFSPYISDILIAREIDMYIDIGHITNDEYLLLVNAIRDKELHNYSVSRYQNKEKLKKGDKAPGFYLKNESDQYLSLKDFKGYLIYLNFWFTGCKPCIKEIPEENHLVDVFKNEKVKIISICMNSDEEVWKQLLMKHHLKTVNLFAGGNWENILKEKYDITGFPHWVLIGGDGKIIENKCFRPGKEAEKEIRKNLIN